MSASDRLTFENILHEAVDRKGIDAVGIVDCASPGVLAEIDEMLRQGEMRVQEGGGLLYRERLAVFPAVEIGVDVGRGEAHFIAYLPDHAAASELSDFLKSHVTNVHLSSQKARADASELRRARSKVVAAFSFPPTHSLRTKVSTDTAPIV